MAVSVDVLHQQTISDVTTSISDVTAPASLRQYSTTDGHLLRVFELPRYTTDLFHGIETTRGTFVIGYRGTSHDEWQYAVSELFRFCHTLLMSITLLF